MFDMGTLETEDAPAQPAAPSRYDTALGNLLRSPDGVVVLREMLARAGVARSVFSTDPALMAFQEGQRNLGLKLFADVARIAPDALPKLLLPEANS